MLRQQITSEYFNWLCDIVCGIRFSKQVSYRKLLTYLHGVEFTYSIPNDENRAENGIDLRWRYCWENNFDYVEIGEYLVGPCSVLEMMVALSIDCENIMDDPQIGDRTGQWFWGMIVNMGLGSMFDKNFKERQVEEIVDRFLERDYEPNGKGGLFTIRRCDEDLRKVEIWHQLCWYLDSIYM